MTLFVLASFTSLILSSVSIPFIIKFAHNNQLFDEIDHRKVHTEDTPRLGGIGIFSAFIISAIIFSWNEMSVQIAVFLGTGIFVYIAGLYDDIKGLQPFLKLMAQIIAASIFAIFTNSFHSIYIPFTGYILELGSSGPILTVLWIVSVSNAVNFIDGVDSLAGGVSLLGLTGYAVIYISLGYLIPALFAVILASAIIGFLIFNFPPAKIFMGDSGSLTIGFILATLPLLEGAQTENPYMLLIAITVLSIPLSDTLAAVIRRVRDKKPVYHPDKHHMHHKLLAMGIRIRFLLLIVYAMAAVPIVLTILWAVLFEFKNADTLIVSAWAIILVFFTILDRKYQKHR